MSTIVTYSKNVVFTTFNRSAEGILALILTAVIARKLSQEDIGIYYMITNIFMMFAVFAEFGTRQIIVREVSKNIDEAPIIMSSGVLLRGIFTIVCLFCLVLFVNLKWTSDYALYACYIYLLWFLPFSLSEAIHAVFTGFEKNEYSVAASLPAKIIGGLFAILIIYMGGNLIPVFIVLTISSFLRLFFSYYLVWKKLFIPKLFIKIANIVYIFKESFPLAIMNGLIQLCSNAGLIVLSFVWGDKEVGFLGIIAIVNRIFSNLAVNLMTPLLPVLSKLIKNDKVKFEETYRRFLKYLFGLALPMGFGIFALSPKIVELFFGSEYSSSIPGLQIIVWSGVLFPFIHFLIYINTSVGLQNLNAKFYFYNLLVTIVLSILLIPRYGFLGVCVANTITSIFTAILFYQSIIRRCIVSFKFQDIPLKQLAASACMCLLICKFSGEANTKGIFNLGFEIFGLTIMGILVYFALLFITGAFDEYDRKSLKKIAMGLIGFFKEKFEKIRFFR